MQNNPPGSHQYTEQEQKQKTDNTTITTQKRTMEEAKWKYSPTQAKRERQNIRNEVTKESEREQQQDERDILESFVKSLHQKSR